MSRNKIPKNIVCGFHGWLLPYILYPCFIFSSFQSLHFNELASGLNSSFSAP